MRKVALVFLLAVFLPSLVLASLALRSLRDQQFALERQRSLFFQGLSDSLAAQVVGHIAERQREFGEHFETLVAAHEAPVLANSFDDRLRQRWPLAEVGFAVSLAGSILSPSPASRPEATLFCVNNSGFLGNREIAEVYLNFPEKGAAPPQSFANSVSSADLPNAAPDPSSLPVKQAPRKVNPLQQSLPAKSQATPEEPAASKVVSAEAEFHQLIGDAPEGMLARFLQNKLKLMFWKRPGSDPHLVFGAQLDLRRLVDGLRDLIRIEDLLREEVCVALLDDNARPVLRSHPEFTADWKRPFVATEIGEALPHWEVAVYFLNPARLTQAARTAQLTLGLLIAMLVAAIAVGSWLIVSDVRRQLHLTRLKTDFVSNVSHELNTPLTSIRMFSELLAEGKVADADKQRSYLQIIAAESSRLTRLINNVLDFARLERGEKKYHFAPCDLGQLALETAESYRPHLEASGFQFEFHSPETPLQVSGDRDALARVMVNLLSNAEKYSHERKEIAIEARASAEPVRHVEISVLDRGTGVPRGCEEKIFEQFYRAHDSLSSGVQGSGLGLTLARQIARAHGGDVIYQPRHGGGSCFTLRLPALTT